MKYIANIMTVDESVPEGKLPNTFPTIAKAIDAAEPGDTIKITPGIYTEPIVVTKPGLLFEPSIRGGDVILQQQVKACFWIDVGLNNSVKINNIKMILTGPNMDLEV